MKRNLRLTIEHKTQEGDNFDEFPEKWEAWQVEWFEFRSATSREFVQAQQVNSTVTHVARSSFVAGYLAAGKNTSLRLREESTGRIFNVLSVTNWMERNRFLDWTLVEANG